MFNFQKIFVVTICIFIANNCTAQIIQQFLHTNWKARQSSSTSWMETKVPGNIHQTLIESKKILDPFYANNLSTCKWVEDEEWEYSLYFDVEDKMYNKKNINLIFEGLDTYAEVKLNGKVILTANNMFMKYSIPVSSNLSKKGNYLSITFKNITNYALQLEKESPIKLPTDYRAYVRKAAFSFGWDFAPRIITTGIYRPVYLETGLANNEKQTKVIPFAIYDTAKAAFSANGKTIFIKGANYVPPSSINFNPSKAYYDSLMMWCKRANINMLRVWGGGIYPDDYFYTACDKNKIMVWQDFMQANAMPPTDPNFAFNLIEEVKYQVTRLYQHPCIVLWCGNNEIEEGWKNWGWKKNLSVSQQNSLYNNYQQLFEIDIPNYIAKIDVSRTYIPTSPKIGWGNANSMKYGDAHYWGIWWGKEPLENFYYKIPRFMSEYGMQALPNSHSLSKMCDANDINMDSINFKTHQKLDNGFETIKHYLNNYFPANIDNQAYIYYTQLLQRDAIRTAVSAQRSAFPYCNGTLLWQLNDCWPAISWSIIDYYNTPKASYYALNELYDENFLAISKKIYEGDKNIIDTSKHSFVLSLNESNYDVTKATTMFTVYDFYGEIIFSTDKIEWKKTKSGVYYTISFFEKNVFEAFNWPLNYLVVDIITKENVKAHKCFTFAPLKHLKLQPAFVSHKFLNDTTIEMNSPIFAKDMYVHSTNSKTTFSNNYFDMLPNEKYKITIQNFNAHTDTIQIKSAVDMSAE
jgi:beta-mannosidase